MIEINTATKKRMLSSSTHPICVFFFWGSSSYFVCFSVVSITFRCVVKNRYTNKKTKKHTNEINVLTLNANGLNEAVYKNRGQNVLTEQVVGCYFVCVYYNMHIIINSCIE